MQRQAPLLARSPGSNSLLMSRNLGIRAGVPYRVTNKGRRVMPVVLSSTIAAHEAVEFSEPSPMGKGSCLRVGMKRNTVLKGDTMLHGEVEAIG